MAAPVTVYGLANCDTVQRARAWLGRQGVAHAFHDFRKQGLDTSTLQAWLRELGHERLLNRRGTTWRRLTEAQREGVVDDASARDLMQAEPSLVKRPVTRWPDGTHTVGFDEAQWAARL